MSVTILWQVGLFRSLQTQYMATVYLEDYVQYRSDHGVISNIAHSWLPNSLDDDAIARDIPTHELVGRISYVLLVGLDGHLAAE
jgi:hypothetical protein